MKTLYLIRHSLTEANEKRLYCGHTDLSLTEAALSSGFSSAARMGEVFRDELRLSPTAYRLKHGI